MFTIIFIFFIILASIQRILEVLSTRERERGEIKAGWTSSVLVTSYIIVWAGTVIEYFSLDREINLIISCLGLGMYLLALVVRNWAIRSLGKYHSIHIEIRQFHELIKEGPYKYLRHPYYASVFLEILGIPLIPNSYYTFLFALLVHLPLVFIRTRWEERELTKKFGLDYIEYKRLVGRFLPFKRRILV